MCERYRFRNLYDNKIYHVTGIHRLDSREICIKIDLESDDGDYDSIIFYPMKESVPDSIPYEYEIIDTDDEEVADQI